MVKIGKFEYELSTAKGKKLMTKVNGKTIHFGQDGYEHFFDKTGLLPTSLNHKDPKRRQNYLSRTANIKDGLGKLTRNNPNSPNYHSRKILW